jgi:trigger factor
MVDTQIDQLRERFADLEDSNAPLIDGNYAEIDIKGYIHDETIEGLTATDYLYEVGSEMLVPKLDEELRGKRSGDILKFNAVLPERFGERAGDEVAFQVLVKDTKKKVLPDVTDDWATEVSEFDTADALRKDIGKRLDLYARVQAQMLVRDRVLEAAAGLVTIDVPDTLVTAEMERRLRDVAHRLEEQGVTMTIPQYLAAIGQDPNQYIEELRGHATQVVRSDLALRSVITQEDIRATEEEIEAEVTRLAEEVEAKPEKVRKDLERRGVLEAVRSDIARGKALSLLVDHATVVDESGKTVDLSLPESASADAVGGDPEAASEEVPEEEPES